MYQSLDNALLIRAAVCRPDQVKAWPDLISSDAASSWPQWIRQALQIPGFAAAVDHASPDLTQRIHAVLAGTAPERDARRVVLAVMRYLLRATTRATPYGLFAGVAAATAHEPATAHVGDNHRPVARIRTPWLDEALARLEADRQLRQDLLVHANDLLTERGELIVLEHRASSTAEGAPVHVRVRVTAAVRVALHSACSPLRWADLVDKVAAGCDVSPAAAERLLGHLLEQRLLVTELRPSMTATDPLAAVLAVLNRLPDQTTPETPVPKSAAEVVNVLRRVAHLKRRHDQARSRAAATSDRRELAAAAAIVSDRPAVAVDLRLDAEIVLPPIVTRETARAAAALTRLSVPAPIGWAAWHRRFLERFGPYALVPVRDAVDPVCGLDYPAGFAGAAPAASPPVTGRDRALVALAQRAALARQREIVVEDDLLAQVGGEAPDTAQASTELTVRVHASSLLDIRAGAFTLTLVRASRNAGTSTGRMLDLLDPAEQQRMAAAYTDGTPRITEGALLSQLVSPTRYAISMDVARAPQVLPHLTPVGEYHTDDDPQQITVNDIAVIADPHRLYLICLSRRRPIQLVPFTAADPARQMTPLARFLAEASTALAAPCHPFDWGPAAHDLPYHPRLRYGRTILSAARWRLTSNDLPAAGASWTNWLGQFTRWRELTGCPSQVSVGSSDQRLALDLDEPAHQALLRDYLARYPVTVLREAPPGAGWIGDRPHEVVVPLVATSPPVPAPTLPAEATCVRQHGFLPGGHHTYLKVYAGLDQQDHVLTGHLDDLLGGQPGEWWFQRYHDPDQHLRLRLTGDRTAPVQRWSENLRAAGLTVRVQLDTDFPEVSRFGGSHAYPSAQTVFAADSAAVIAQLTATGSSNGPHPQALTAASMLDIVTAVLGGPDAACRWLTEHTRPQRTAPPRPVYNQAVHLADPERTAFTAAPWGEGILAAWRARATALAAYRDVRQAAGTDPATLLPDLLHLHHTRLTGPDRDAEGVCLHLARAAALSWSARTRSRS
ncbi:lantibiotic dehydratase [Actinoplanes aureus]|uniref:Lantibiotic dehydratase n=1 Tax=Actinoplanes aureus TaxID=2792083 RepID=A0A931CLD6_9ACTN|nr:lantibiotic dehydratase [Actinoplanes aureus]MBG0569151.1 lantibiotic dehydratase [Actinoplanes aureus]